MPKNKKGGSKHKKRKNKDILESTKRKLVKRLGDKDEYAIVRKALGNCRFTVICTNQHNNDKDECKERIAHIRGKLKRVRVRIGDVILVAIRPYQDTKCDIVHIYFPDEIEKLKQQGELDQLDDFASYNNNENSDSEDSDDQQDIYNK